MRVIGAVEMQRFFSGLFKGYRFVFTFLLFIVVMWGFVGSAACIQNLGERCELDKFWLGILLTPEVVATIATLFPLPLTYAFSEIPRADDRWVTKAIWYKVGIAAWIGAMLGLLVAVFALFPGLLIGE